MGQFQEAVVDALRIKWNGCAARHVFTHNSRGVLHRHSWPVSVIKTGSVISKPPSSTPDLGNEFSDILNIANGLYDQFNTIKIKV